ncbi:MAG: RtcB family protein [Methanogenium sp.]|nr:RtcB family protein [Methanogenium sp.]
MLEGIRKLNEIEWEVPKGFIDNMQVPGRFFLSDSLAATLDDGAVRQLANVATMPGIQKYSLAMPDIHWGYGFPIGGVAAFDMETGVISPGGVGFDINCGVRLITTPLKKSDLKDKKKLIEDIFRTIPTGVGTKSARRLTDHELSEIITDGAGWAVGQGYGMESDLDRCEGRGCMKEASMSDISTKALQRGLPQCGTLGSGNHFLEFQNVGEILDENAARVFGIEEDQVCFMIHCGSRGFGHQICTDHLKTLEAATKKYNIKLPDRQLACAPLTSPEGEAYFGAMAAAANYAWTNRQMITHLTRKVLEKTFGIDYDEMHLIYDVTHNVAKIEEHVIDGVKKKVCVHRKGATRAFGPGHRELPSDIRGVGQPVIIPGSMGTASYLLKGTAKAMEKTFGSTCHGAGRVMSRSKAKHNLRGADIISELAARGIIVKATSNAVIAEEAPDAYKSVSEVVNVVHRAGISMEVARLEPLGVIKG